MLPGRSGSFWKAVCALTFGALIRSAGSARAKASHFADSSNKGLGVSAALVCCGAGANSVLFRSAARSLLGVSDQSWFLSLDWSSSSCEPISPISESIAAALEEVLASPELSIAARIPASSCSREISPPPFVSACVGTPLPSLPGVANSWPAGADDICLRAAVGASDQSSLLSLDWSSVSCEPISFISMLLSVCKG